MADLDSLGLPDHPASLYFPETQADLGLRKDLEMPREHPRENPSLLLPHGGRTHQDIQGLLLNLSCQEPPSLPGGRKTLYQMNMDIKNRE